MRLNRRSSLAGHPIKRVRDFLRENSEWRNNALARFFEVGPSEAKEINDVLVSEGFATTTTDKWGTLYAITLNGGSLSSAKLLKPINRAKADELIKELLARVEAVNADPELLETVTRVSAFGSYITDRPDLGDIDLVVDRIRRGPPNGLGSGLTT